MIVITMAGLSARFTAAGYRLPKYMLELDGRTLFEHSLASFAAYFDSRAFLLVCRDVHGTPAFVATRMAALGVKAFSIVVLDAPTSGQAETAELGLMRAHVDPETPVTLFNIDTFRPGYAFPDDTLIEADGYLEVFHGAGDNWSFARLDADGYVVETTEKRPVSDLCSTGLYHFRRSGDFLAAVEAARADASLQGPGGELYVAPLYNKLIAEGRRIGVQVVDRDQVVFCGVPQEYWGLGGPRAG